MVRSAAVILALILLPGVAQAQQQHTVVDGETLWSLAQRYYGDPWGWPRIYEANRAPDGEVEDPHWIYPGEVFVIPDVGATPVVAEVVVEPASEDPAPAPAPAPTGQPRTVFYSTGSGAGFGSSAAPANRLAVPRDVSVAAPWLGPVSGDPPSIGRVVGFAGAEDERAPRETAFPYDRVEVTLPGLAPARGAELLAFRVVGRIPGVGQVLRPTGVLAVSDPTPDGAIALVVTVFDRLNVGDHLQLLPAFPLQAGRTAQSVAGDVGAIILGFASPHAFQKLYDVAFLDRGSDDGVSVGDEYVVVWDEGTGVPAEVEGRLQVISVHPDHASAHIIWLRNPVFEAGRRVALDRKMP